MLKIVVVWDGMGITGARTVGDGDKYLFPCSSL